MKVTINRAAAALLAATVSAVTLQASPATATPAAPSAAVANPTSGPGGDFLGALLGFLGAFGGSPSLAWSPTTSTGTYDYGTVDSATTQPQTFALKNSGRGTSGALKVALTGSSAFAITGNTCAKKWLAPKKTCTVTVRYAPTAPGANDTATLVASSKFPKAAATITLAGSSPAPAVQPTFTFSSVLEDQTQFDRFCHLHTVVSGLPPGTYHLHLVYDNGNVEDTPPFTITERIPTYDKEDSLNYSPTTRSAQVIDETTGNPVGEPSEMHTFSC